MPRTKSIKISSAVCGPFGTFDNFRVNKITAAMITAVTTHIVITASVINGTALPPISTLQYTWLSTDMRNDITRGIILMKVYN